MKGERVELAIHELVLRGIDSVDGQRIGEAFQRELTQLLSERGLPPGFETGAGIQALKVAMAGISRGSSPEAIGTRTARAVFGALKR